MAGPLPVRTDALLRLSPTRPAAQAIPRRRRLPRAAFTDKRRATMSEALLSFEPATGKELWRGAISDVDAEVAIARRGWPEWAAKPLTFRSETLRRFADRVKAE